jgi:hypothetical protein
MVAWLTVAGNRTRVNAARQAMAATRIQVVHRGCSARRQLVGEVSSKRSDAVQLADQADKIELFTRWGSWRENCGISLYYQIARQPSDAQPIRPIYLHVACRLAVRVACIVLSAHGLCRSFQRDDDDIYVLRQAELQCDSGHAAHSGW